VTTQLSKTFEFEFQKRYAPFLAAFGITPKTTSVRITPTEMVARFGPFSCRSPLENITCVSISGPYSAYKAIGARGSFADGGVTFGSTTAGGVCMEFRKGVTALDPTKRFRHRGLTVTLRDRVHFAAYLREAAGLPTMEAAG
jgi:hypothetical protein